MPLGKGTIRHQRATASAIRSTTKRTSALAYAMRFGEGCAPVYSSIT